MKITDKELKPSHAYHKINIFCDEWDAKEGPGKSMKNALYLQWHGKRHLSVSGTSNNLLFGASLSEPHTGESPTHDL